MLAKKYNHLEDIFAGIKEQDENRKPVWGKVMVVSLLISAALMIHVLSFL